jgi:eukaryotic-like serine/threonine-protein kinase
MTDLTGRLLGRYRLETLLGRGGMAEVWKATDTKLTRTVAVKVINSSYAQDPQFAERFLREARVVASLEHPNILPVYDFGDEGGIPFLVMPHLAGGTLRERLRGAPAPLPFAAAWIRQLADALDAAHAAGILHRDVKPANALLGKDDRLFLADFGIAKMVESITGLTATGVVVGTPVYMAPEQAQGRPATPATDRYALAVVAYEILAGRPPFEGDNPLSLMHQHVSTPAPALSTKVGGLPAGLDAVFQSALSKDPAGRQPSCRALADAVYAFVPTGAVPVIGSAPWGTHGGSATTPTVLQDRGPTPPAGTPGTKPWEPPFPTSTPDRPVTPAPVRVSTPPASLTSDATVLTAGRRKRRGLVWGVAVSAVALAALGFVAKARRDAATASLAQQPPAPTPLPAVPTPAPAAPVTVVEIPVPPTVAPAAPTPDARAIADAKIRTKEEKRITDLEKRVQDAEAAAREARTSAEMAAAAEKATEEKAAAEKQANESAGAAARPAMGNVAPPEPPQPMSALAAARERLDISKKPGHRLAKDDFQFAQLEARRVLAEHPKSQEAHYVSTYATGGIAYAGGNDAVASALVVEALVGLRRAAKNEPRIFSILVVKPDGTIVPPRGWELAICYGDVRGEALGLLDAAIRENPRDGRALRARAQLRRARGLEPAPPPGVWRRPG